MEEVLEHKPKTAISALGNDELVKLYVQLRDRRTVRKKEFEAADEQDKAKLERIEGVLLVRFNESGSESVRTKEGTAYKHKSTYASVGDRDAFVGYVKATQDFELMDVRANKTAIQQHLEASGDLPPGINWREEIHIRVNRA